MGFWLGLAAGLVFWAEFGALVLGGGFLFAGIVFFYGGMSFV